MPTHRLTWGAVFLLSACGGSGTLMRFDQPQPQQISIDFDNGESVKPKFSSGGVVTASIDPDSDVTQIIQAASDSAIADTAVAFPPGSLAIATDITVQVGSDSLTEALSLELPLSAGNSVVSGGTPVQIDASNVADLKQPFVLALAIPAAPGLVGDSTDRLAIMYQVKKDNGTRLEAGIVPRSQLNLENGKILFPSQYFGWFRAVYLTNVETQTLVADSTAKAYIGLKLVQDAASLPACAQTDIGVTVYVASEKTFRTCAATGWVAIDLKGAKGATGAAGAAGANGAPGAAGATGPAGAFLVKSAGGTVIGTLISLADWGQLLVRLSNGHDLGLYTSGSYLYLGQKDISPSMYVSTLNKTFAVSCSYKLPDCGGNCLLIGGGTPNMTYLGAAGQLVANPSDASIMYTDSGFMSSAWIPEIGQCRNHSVNDPAPPYSGFTSIYSITTSVASPATLSFPFTGPLRIESN